MLIDLFTFSLILLITFGTQHATTLPTSPSPSPMLSPPTLAPPLLFPSFNLTTTTTDNLTLSSPPPTSHRLNLRITYHHGYLITKVDMAAEVCLGWQFYEYQLHGRATVYDSRAPFAGYTALGNYKDLHLRSRYYPVVGNALGIHLTNWEAGTWAAEAYRRFMRSWTIDKTWYSGVEWVLEGEVMDGAGSDSEGGSGGSGEGSGRGRGSGGTSPSRDVVVVARGAIDRDPSGSRAGPGDTTA